MKQHSGTNKVNILRIDLPEQSSGTTDESSSHIAIDVLGDILVDLEVRLGSTHPKIRELMALHTGSILTLEQQVSDDVDVLLNGRVVARGEIIAVGNHFGVRVTELAKSQSPADVGDKLLAVALKS